jgi:ATP-binding protein involved in chromosome partitioning
MFDPRLSLLEKRSEHIKNIILIGSGKGGVGKSIISSATSYILSLKGYDVAYLDLDFYGPAGQNMFPVNVQFRGGRSGMELPISDGVRVMSIGYFLGDSPFPLSGKDKIDILVDFFSILNLGQLDFMVIDLPPGMGDELTFTQRIFRDKVSIVVITIDSELSLNVAERLVRYIKIEKINFLGIVVNMINLFREYNPKQIEQRLQGEILGAISYHPRLEEFKTIKSKLENVHEFRREIEHIVDGLIKKLNF